MARARTVLSAAGKTSIDKRTIATAVREVVGNARTKEFARGTLDSEASKILLEAAPYLKVVERPTTRKPWVTLTLKNERAASTTNKLNRLLKKLDEVHTTKRGGITFYKIRNPKRFASRRAFGKFAWARVVPDITGKK